MTLYIPVACIYAYWGGGGGGRFENTYELLNLRALKYSHVNKIHIFQWMYGLDILCGKKGTLWKISDPYIKKYDFYTIFEM